MLDLRFRPYDRWPQAATPVRKNGTFRVAYNKLLDDLERELDHLGATDITVATGHRREDIRNDGWPRSNARQPHSPGVIVYFQSKHGPLSFACDTYLDWKDNLRGIGLTMEALRAVDRHGATKKGQQYRGYTSIPAGEKPAASGNSSAKTDPRRAAAVLLLREGGFDVTEANISALNRDPALLKRAFGAAALKVHSDTGGDDERFMAVRAAHELLKKQPAQEAGH